MYIRELHGDPIIASGCIILAVSPKHTHALAMQTKLTYKPTMETIRVCHHFIAAHNAINPQCCGLAKHSKLVDYHMALSLHHSPQLTANRTVTVDPDGPHSMPKGTPPLAPHCTVAHTSNSRRLL
jgi:hypothetical protein